MQLPTAPMLSCARKMLVLCLEGILIACLGVGCFVVLRLWLLVAGYAFLAHAHPLGCPGIFAVAS